MGLNVGSTPVKAVYVGSTPVTAVYVGAEKVWPSFSGPVVYDVVNPGTFELDIPPGAGYVAVTLTGGGRAGEPGDGVFNKAGMGGDAGAVSWFAKSTAGYDLPIEITVGAGGKPSGSKNSPTATGKPSKVVLNGSSRDPDEISADGGSNIVGYQNGYLRGWDKQNPSYDRTLEMSLAETYLGGPLHVDDDGLWNGPGGTGDGGAGTRGGGGAGGNGGILGKHSLGGAGGDGAVRIVFWRDKEEMLNFTA